VSSQQDEASTQGPAPDGAGVPPASQAGAGTAKASAKADVGPTAGKVTADGKILFRRLTPSILWWAWIAFALLNVVDIVVPDRNYFSIELAGGLLTVTAVIYACTLRPRLTADDDAVVIRNPFRTHQVGWGGVKGVFLGDSVEFTCARPAPMKDKIIYCWALYTSRRPRKRAQAQRSIMPSMRGGGRVSNEVSDLQRQNPVELMAAELGRRCKQARERGAPDAVLESSWAWRPLAGTLALAAATLVLILVR
jgi:hypothetical protein